MSAENIEVVRRWFAAMSAGPEQGLAELDKLYDPDVDFYPVRKFLEVSPRHGVEEVRQFISQFFEAYSLSAFEVRDVIAVGDDRVLACVVLRAEGRGSGIELEGDIFHAFWLRHGRIFRMDDHLTLKGALHALGFEAETLEAAELRPSG